jgi:hypothetical protein
MDLMLKFMNLTASPGDFALHGKKVVIQLMDASTGLQGQVRLTVFIPCGKSWELSRDDECMTMKSFTVSQGLMEGLLYCIATPTGWKNI